MKKRTQFHGMGTFKHLLKAGLGLEPHLRGGEKTVRAGRTQAEFSAPSVGGFASSDN